MTDNPQEVQSKDEKTDSTTVKPPSTVNISQEQNDARVPKKNNKKYLTPVIIAAGLAIIHVLLSWFFVQCPLGCQELDGKLLSIVDKNKNLNINSAAKKLNPDKNENSNKSVKAETNSGANINVNITAVREQVEQLKTVVDELPESNLIKSIDKLKKEVSGEPPTEEEDEAVRTANVTNADDSSAQTSAAETDGNENKKGVASKKPKKDPLRESLQKRYSGRITWVLLTTLLCALFFGTIWFAYYVGRAALKENEIVSKLYTNSSAIFSNAAWITSVVAVAFLVAGIVINLWLSVSDSMFKPTIYDLEGIAGWWFGISNGIVFAAAVFLVAASWAIYYKVQKTNTETPKVIKVKQELEEELEKNEARLEKLEELSESEALSENQKTEMDKLPDRIKGNTKDLKKINDDLRDKYKDWRVYSKGLLYLGGAVLTVGLIRLQTLADWHIAFVNENSAVWLKAFFQTSLYNQAVFYTALLMAIYLPIIYILPETADSPSVETSLEKNNFFTTLMKFAPQIVALLSPVLASGAWKFVEGFIK